jgi:hypothetical protein
MILDIRFTVNKGKADTFILLHCTVEQIHFPVSRFHFPIVSISLLFVSLLLLLVETNIATPNYEIRHTDVVGLRKGVASRVGSTPRLYIGGPRFKSRPRDRLPWLMFSWFSWLPLGEFGDCIWGHDRFLSHPLLFSTGEPVLTNFQEMNNSYCHAIQWLCAGSGLEIGFIDHFNTWLVSTLNYSANGNLHALKITRARRLVFSVCYSRHQSFPDNGF